jgi:hypothetical protein
MIHYSISHSRSGEDSEREIQAWLARLPCPISNAYVWPGTIPDQDLADMARALPGWEYDCAVIYYQRWDPEIPHMVSAFNLVQDQFQARFWRRFEHSAPEHVIAVIPTRAWQVAHIAHFITQSGARTWNDDDQHPGKGG